MAADSTSDNLTRKNSHCALMCSICFIVRIHMPHSTRRRVDLIDTCHTGSPFQFTVGPIVGGGPHKVRAVGSGLVRGQVNKPSQSRTIYVYLSVSLSVCVYVKVK